jgi:DNA-binding LacI/PurR family transcriptional regulator
MIQTTQVKSLDVARLAGVSRTTVSYVLNGRTDVSIPEETRNRVHKAALELGYKPNMAARALVMGRTGIISLWLIQSSSIRNQADVIQNLQQKVNQDGNEFMMHRVSQNSAENNTDKTPSDWQVDGVLGYNLAPINGVISTSQPFVGCGCYCELAGDYVSIDLKPGVVQAVHHLVSTGRRKIAYLSNRWGVRPEDARYQGYVETMAHYGMEPLILMADFANAASGRSATKAFLASGGEIDALVGFSDELALGAYRALLDSGRVVPDDCAITGVDGLDELEYLEVPITTIVQPIEQMCRMAWDFLKNRIEEPGIASQQVVLPANLVIRESTGC